MSGNLEQFNKKKFYFVVGAASIVYGVLKLFDKATSGDDVELEDDGDYYWEPVDETTDYQD